MRPREESSAFQMNEENAREGAATVDFVNVQLTQVSTGASFIFHVTHIYRILV